MARYGGGTEDFNEEAAQLAKRTRARQELAAKEASYRGEVAATEGAITSEGQARVIQTKVAKEQEEVAKRIEQASAARPRVIQQSTRAIEENTAARRRNAEAMREQEQAAGRSARLVGYHGTSVGPDVVMREGLQRGSYLAQRRAAAQTYQSQGGYLYSVDYSGLRKREIQGESRFRQAIPPERIRVAQSTRVDLPASAAKQVAGLVSEDTRRAIAASGVRQAVTLNRAQAGDVHQALEKVTAPWAEAMRRDLGGWLGGIEKLEAATRAAAARRAPDPFRGARDPLFAEATARGLDTQYALRRTLGVGQGRAANLQQALRSSLQPGVTGATAPLTRQQAAVVGVTQADADLEEAKRRYAATMRRKSASEDDRVQAYQEREAAANRRRASKVELESAEAEATARHARAEEAARIARQPPPPTPPGTGLVPRTPANAGLRSAQELQAATVSYYGRPGPAYGQYPYAPIGRERIRGLGEIERSTDPAARDRDAASRLAVPKGSQSTGSQLAAAAQAQAKAQAELNALHARAVTFLDNQAAAEDRARRATHLAAVEYGTSSQALRRHGALTSEFIAAAARGETTFRELGFQATATIGKFAGWSVAASAVYGAVSAVHQLGTGAVNAQAGVHQLDRVINGVNSDQASQAFRDLAHQFNVPLDVAADAVYRMGQRFHSLPEAVEAAKASLYSFKTGEVDVATSTENLLAVVNGFGLGANQLSGVYDQINQAQNTFGIKIGETEAGLAKAAGTYRNAGGDLNTLLGIFVAISRATNRSGQEIGTGIARGVQNIRKPAAQKLLRDAGVDVDPNNFQSTLLSAMQQARKGADVQSLAVGLLGPQYARLLTAVLKDQTNFNAAMRDTSPAASQGSAQRELEKVLKQVNEQAARLGINLQRLGAALADSHALDIFGGLLKLLNGSLELAVHLVDAFDKLPDGVQQAVVYLGEAAGLLAVMRRIGPSAELGQRFPVLQPLTRDPDQRLKTLAVLGQRDQVKLLQDEQEAATRRRARERVAVEAARQDVGAFDVAHGPAIRTLPEDDPRRAKLVNDRLELERQVQEAERRVNRSQQETVQLKKVSLAAEEELATIEQMHRTQVARYLYENDIPIPVELDRPSARGAEYIGGLRNPAPASGLTDAAAVGLGAGLASSDGERIAREATEAQAKLAEGIAQTTEAVQGLHESLDATDIREQLAKPIEQAQQVKEGTAAPIGRTPPPPRPVRAPGVLSGALESTANQLAVQRLAVQDALSKHLDGLGDVVGKTSISGRALANAAERTAAIGDRGVAAIRGAGGALRGAASSLRAMAGSLIASFGPLDALIAGFIAYQTISAKSNEIRQRQQELDKSLSQPVSTKGQYEERVKALREQADEGKNFFVSAASGLKHPLHLFDNQSVYAQAVDKRRAAAREELRKLGEEDPEKAAGDKLLRARDYTSGAPVHHRFLADIQSNANKLAENVTSGVISLGEFNDEIDKRIEELYRSRYINRTNQRSGRRSLEQVRRSALASITPSDFSGRFNNASAEELRAQLELSSAQGAIPGGNITQPGPVKTPGFGVNFRLAEMRSEYNHLRRLTQNPSSPEELVKVLQDRAAFYKGVDDAVQGDLAVGLAAATSDRAADAAYARALRLSNAPVQSARDAKQSTAAQLKKAKEDQAAAQKALQDAQTRAGNLGGGTPLRPATGGLSAVTEAAANYRRITDEVRRLEQQNRTDTNLLNQAIAERGPAGDALTEARFDHAQSTRDLRRDLDASKLPSDDDAGRNAVAERYARKNLAAAKRYKGPNRLGKVRSAEITLNDILNQATTTANDDALAAIRAAGELAEARAGNDPVARGNAAVSSAQRVLAYIQGHGGKPSEILGAQAEVVNAQNTVSDAISSQADAVASLSSQIAQAKAEGDPVQQAKLAQQAARAAAGRASNQEERLQATLDAINANNELQQAIQDREQARFEFLQSLTDDPVKQARLQERADASATKATKKGSADWYRARAKQNNDRRATIQARVDSQTEDINFNLEMEKISTETAISQYKSLLKMKGLTKSVRRDILRQIHQLQKDEDSSFADLQIGNIKLPTMYDVRRLAQTGTQGVAISNRNNLVVHVHNDADVNKFSEALEGITGASMRAGMRSAGYAG
jgi:TP901 family phage tail tape measure protein